MAANSDAHVATIHILILLNYSFYDVWTTLYSSELNNYTHDPRA